MVYEKQTAIPGMPAKWLTCNGQQLRRLAQAALIHLEANYQRVNELNVFPVPDGDTGTNMLLTMRAAYRRIESSDEMHVGRLAQALAQGALMGGRGNSGVILSQILRGLARPLRDIAAFGATDLAAALTEAAQTAYGGVMRPVEGTVLTVIREAAEEANDAAEKSADLRFVLERVLERSQQALERTPEQLPILKQAGVVDSGGQGLVFLFEGMLRYVHGELPTGDGPGQAAVTVTPAQALAVPEGGDLENPYDVQFIILGQKLNVLQVRETIDAMGDSTVVVGDESVIKVHVHVKDPGQPISYGISLGEITDVVVENMQLQMEEIVGPAAGPAMQLPEPVNLLEPGQIGVVAVAAGEGLARIFTSLGAAAIVYGGQTNNPSTEELFQAIQDVPTNRVIVLPNNKNIILTAESARDLSPKEVVVVPTVTACQGISAILGLNPDGDLQAMAEAMSAASRSVMTGEITRATRSVELDGVAVQEGDVIGLANGRLCCSGSTVEAVVRDTLEAMDVADRELVTIYYGSEVDPADASGMAECVGRLYPELEVELLFGGQAHYFYILGAE